MKFVTKLFLSFVCISSLTGIQISAGQKEEKSSLLEQLFGRSPKKQGEVDPCRNCEVAFISEFAPKVCTNFLEDRVKRTAQENPGNFFILFLARLSILKRYEAILTQYLKTKKISDHDRKEFNGFRGSLRILEEIYKNDRPLFLAGAKKEQTDSTTRILFDHVNHIKTFISNFKLGVECTDQTCILRAKKLVGKEIMQQFVTFAFDPLSKESAQINEPIKKVLSILANMQIDKPSVKYARDVMAPLSSLLRRVKQINRKIISIPSIKRLLSVYLAGVVSITDVPEKKKLQDAIDSLNLRRLIERFGDEHTKRTIIPTVIELASIAQKLKTIFNSEQWKKAALKNKSIQNFLRTALSVYSQIVLLLSGQHKFTIRKKVKPTKIAVEEAPILPPSTEELEESLERANQNAIAVNLRAESEKLPQLEKELIESNQQQEHISKKLVEAQKEQAELVQVSGQKYEGIGKKQEWEKYKSTIQANLAEQNEKIKKLEKDLQTIQAKRNELIEQLAETTKAIQDLRPEIIERITELQKELENFIDRYKLPKIVSIPRSTKRMLEIQAEYHRLRTAITKIIEEKQDLDSLSDELLADLLTQRVNAYVDREHLLSLYKQLVPEKERERIEEQQKISPEEYRQHGKIVEKEQIKSQTVESVRKEFKEKEALERKQFYEAQKRAIEFILKNELPKSIKLTPEVAEKLKAKITIVNNQIDIPLEQLTENFDSQNPDESNFKINESFIHVFKIANLWNSHEPSSDLQRITLLSENDKIKLENALQTACDALEEQYIPIIPATRQLFSDFSKELHGLAESLYLYVSKEGELSLPFQITGDKKYNDAMQKIFKTVIETKFTPGNANASIKELKSAQSDFQQLWKNFSESTQKVDPSRVTFFTPAQKDELKKISVMAQENYKAVQPLLPPKPPLKKVEEEKISIPEEIKIVGKKSIPEWKTEFEDLRNEITKNLLAQKIQKKVAPPQAKENIKILVDEYNAMINDFMEGNPPYWFDEDHPEESVQKLKNFEIEIYEKLEEIEKPRIFKVKETTEEEKVAVEEISIPKEIKIVEKSVEEWKAEFDQIKDKIINDLDTGKIKKKFKALPDKDINKDANKMIDTYNRMIDDFIKENPPYGFDKKSPEVSVQTLQILRSKLDILKSEIYKKIEEIKNPRIFKVKEKSEVETGTKQIKIPQDILEPTDESEEEEEELSGKPEEQYTIGSVEELAQEEERQQKIEEKYKKVEKTTNQLKEEYVQQATTVQQRETVVKPKMIKRITTLQNELLNLIARYKLPAFVIAFSFKAAEYYRLRNALTKATQQGNLKTLSGAELVRVLDQVTEAYINFETLLSWYKQIVSKKERERIEKQQQEEPKESAMEYFTPIEED